MAVPLATGYEFCISEGYHSFYVSTVAYLARPHISPAPRNGPSLGLVALDEVFDGPVLNAYRSQSLDNDLDTGILPQHAGIPLTSMLQHLAFLDHTAHKRHFPTWSHHLDIHSCAC